MSRAFALAGAALLLSACCVSPFHNTDRAGDPHGRPGDPEEQARESIQPEQPAMQSAADREANPEAGFDIRLVRVQPGVHVNTEQSCDIVYVGNSEAIEGDASGRYNVHAVQRMSVKCGAPTGEGWADLVFTPERVARSTEVQRGRRVRLRVRAADGGYFDYPIVEFLSVVGPSPASALAPPRPGGDAVPNGFDLRQLEEAPAMIGTTQQCAVAFAGEIDLVRPNDRRTRAYPAGVQNRMTVRCKHAAGEEAADLIFMPAQALAALRVRRGEMLPVRVISRNGGTVDYPILQFAGQ